MKKVICIVGPTGSGKTKLSIDIARHFGAEIINGDSVSIYQQLDIGSAKITKDEMHGIPHHLISCVPLDQTYTVYNFQQDVRGLIKDIKQPLIVGGSGLYIKSALYDYEFETQNDVTYPPINEMVEALKKNDPDAAIDFNNQRRIQSAYRVLMSGQKRSEKNKKNEPLYDIFLIYLDIDRAMLKVRLALRLEQMIEKGFIEETKNLMSYELNIIGYREIQAYLNGTFTLDEAKDKIITSTMRFAKRQKTWFINQMQPHVYDALNSNLKKNIIEDLNVFLGVNKS